MATKLAASHRRGVEHEQDIRLPSCRSPLSVRKLSSKTISRLARRPSSLPGLPEDRLGARSKSGRAPAKSRCSWSSQARLFQLVAVSGCSPGAGLRTATVRWWLKLGSSGETGDATGETGDGRNRVDVSRGRRVCDATSDGRHGGRSGRRGRRRGSGRRRGRRRGGRGHLAVARAACDRRLIRGLRCRSLPARERRAHVLPRPPSCLAGDRASAHNRHVVVSEAAACASLGPAEALDGRARAAGAARGRGGGDRPKNRIPAGSLGGATDERPCRHPVRLADRPARHPGLAVGRAQAPHRRQVGRRPSRARPSRSTTRRPARSSPRSPRATRPTSTWPSRPPARRSRTGPWPQDERRRARPAAAQARRPDREAQRRAGRARIARQRQAVSRDARAADLPLAINCYRYYAGWADKIHGKTIPVDGPATSATRGASRSASSARSSRGTSRC